MTLSELKNKRPSQFKLLEYLLARTNDDNAVMVSTTTLADKFNIKRFNMTLLIDGLHNAGFVNIIPIDHSILFIFSNTEVIEYKSECIKNNLIVSDIINANVIYSNKLLSSIVKATTDMPF